MAGVVTVVALPEHLTSWAAAVVCEFIKTFPCVQFKVAIVAAIWLSKGHLFILIVIWFFIVVFFSGLSRRDRPVWVVMIGWLLPRRCIGLLRLHDVWRAQNRRRSLISDVCLLPCLCFELRRFLFFIFFILALFILTWLVLSRPLAPNLSCINIILNKQTCLALAAEIGFLRVENGRASVSEDCGVRSH